MRFHSTWVDRDGRSGAEVLEASSAQELHERLHGQGRMLVRAQPAAVPVRDATRVRLRPRQVVNLLRALQSALDAGVPLLRVLDALWEQEGDRRAAAVHADLARRVAGGEPLSAAMAAHRRSFPPVACALVRVGESSGSLPDVLGAMAGHAEWHMSIRGTVRQALVYPAIVLGAGYGLVLFLLSFVVPRLGGVVARLGTELPAASQVLFAASGFVAGHVGAILLGTLAAVSAMAMLLRSDAGRAAAAALLARLPLVRGVVRAMDRAQLCRNLTVMLGAGLMVTGALEHAAAAAVLPGTRRGLLAARDDLLAGRPLTDSLADQRLLPPVSLSLLRVSEASGRLPATLDRLGAVHDEEARDAVRRLLGMLEPALTVLLGAIVGGVAVVVVTTVYSAMQGMGR